MRFASTPTACTSFVRESIATTDGSESTIPRPRTYTSVFAVPRSTAMSRPPKPVSPEKRPMETRAECIGRPPRPGGSLRRLLPEPVDARKPLRHIPDV
jgi:hypothetical protein